jgi:hypothetical protein
MQLYGNLARRVVATALCLDGWTSLYFSDYRPIYYDHHYELLQYRTELAQVWRDGSSLPRTHSTAQREPIRGLFCGSQGRSFSGWVG